MDLKDLDFASKAEEGFDVVLLHPIDETELEHEDKKMFIRVVGADSVTFRNIKNRKSREAQIERIKQSKKKGQEKLIDLDEVAVEISEMLQECTLGGDVYLDGKWIKLTNKNSFDIYAQYEWIRTQIDRAMSDKENLMRDAKKN